MSEEHQQGGGYRGRGRGRGGRGGYRKYQEQPQQSEATPVNEVLTETEKIFVEFQKQLDADNDQRERIYKAARDVVIESKRVIFTLQRIKVKENDSKTDIENEKIFQEAEQSLNRILGDIGKIAEEVNQKEENYWKYNPKFTFGLQEYIEALSFYHYLTTKTLISKEEIDNTLQKAEPASLKISYIDYILGVSDLGGELMRFATNNVSVNRNVAWEVRDFLLTVHRGFLSLNLFGDLISKEKILQACLIKVENLCYNIILQESEALPLQDMVSHMVLQRDENATNQSNMEVEENTY